MNYDKFERSGLASKSDIAAIEWKNIFYALKRDQSLFLSNKKYFLNAEYKWTHDPLHTWSRVWEYPYVYYHLRAWRRNKRKENKKPCIVDLGSGITFFPFSIADIGYDVICTGIDPVCKRGIEIASMFSPKSKNDIFFRLIEDGDTSLPFLDNEADVVYCISVLEHIYLFERTVLEVGRILKTGGLFLLTIDISINGNREMGVSVYKKLMEIIEKYFDFLYPVKTVHPNDLLLSNSGQYPYHDTSSLLAVEGMVLIKK